MKMFFLRKFKINVKKYSGVVSLKNMVTLQYFEKLAKSQPKLNFSEIRVEIDAYNILLSKSLSLNLDSKFFI